MAASAMDRMRQLHRVSLAAAVALVTVTVSAEPATGQDSEISVDPRAGLEFPVGGLSEIHSFGFTGGVGVSFAIHPHINLRGDFDAGILNEKSGIQTPSLTVLHYNAGIEFDFTAPEFQEFPLSFRWNLGAGATTLTGDESFAGAEDVDFSQTYPSITTGAKIGYALTPRIELFAGGSLHLIFAEESETVELFKNAPGRQPFGNTWSAPVTLGVDLSVQ